MDLEGKTQMISVKYDHSKNHQGCSISNLAEDIDLTKSLFSIFAKFEK